MAERVLSFGRNLTNLIEFLLWRIVEWRLADLIIKDHLVRETLLLRADILTVSKLYSLDAGCSSCHDGKSILNRINVHIGCLLI
jgi:hypothetical protein